MLLILLDKPGEYCYDDLRDLIPATGKVYTTNDTTFFDFDDMDRFEDVILLRLKTGEYLSARHVLENNPGYKAIRRTHNIMKMFHSTFFEGHMQKHNCNTIQEFLETINK